VVKKRLQTTKEKVQRFFYAVLFHYAVFFGAAFFDAAFFDDADLVPATLGFLAAEAGFFAPPLCFDAADFGLATFDGEVAFLTAAGFGPLVVALFFVDAEGDFVEAFVFGLASRGAFGFDGEVDRLLVPDEAFFGFAAVDDVDFFFATAVFFGLPVVLLTDFFLVTFLPLEVAVPNLNDPLAPVPFVCRK